MKNAIDSLAEFFTSSKIAKKNGSQEADIQSSDVFLSRTNKSRAVPQERLQKLRLTIPIAASNLLTFSFKRFCERCANAFETALSEVPTKSAGSIDETMNNSNRDRTVCFKMPKTGHYYIGLTVHTFIDFISDCI